MSELHLIIVLLLVGSIITGFADYWDGPNFPKTLDSALCIRVIGRLLVFVSFSGLQGLLNNTIGAAIIVVVLSTVINILSEKLFTKLLPERTVFA